MLTFSYFHKVLTVCDRNKRFLDISVGVLGSTNDSRMLKCLSLYWQATTSNQLFDRAFSQEGFSPYVIGDKGYPLYPWLRDLLEVRLSVSEQLYQRKLRKGRCVIENSFGILKQSF